MTEEMTSALLRGYSKTLVDLFGADPTGVKCSADAFEAADQSLGDPYKGGILQLGIGTYRMSRTPRMKRHGVIQGKYGLSLSPRTIIMPDAGVTGLRIECTSMSGVGSDGAGHSTIKGIAFYAALRNTHQFTCAYDPNSTYTTVPGAVGTVAAGSRVIHVDGVTTAFYEGLRLKLGDAFSGIEEYNAVVAVDGHEITMQIPAAVEALGQPFVMIENLIVCDTETDFIVGQNIRIRGCGELTGINPILASTAAGSSTVLISQDVDGIPIVPFATYLVLGSAYPNPTQVLSRDNAAHTIEMASPAAATLQDLDVKVRSNIYTRVQKVYPGGRKIAHDNTANGALTVAATIVEHADAGVDLRNTGHVRDCSFVSFQGPGINNVASHSFNPAALANACTAKRIMSDSCMHTIIASGVDAQAGEFSACWGVNTREWNFVDDTQAGNAWTAGHASGGYGFFTRDGCPANVKDFYLENGTISSFGSWTQVASAKGSPDQGGNSWCSGAGIMNHLQIGADGYHKNVTDFSPRKWFARFSEAAYTTRSLIFKKADPSESAFGIDAYLWRAEAFREVPLAFMNEASYHEGGLWSPRGMLIGDNVNHYLNPADVACRRLESLQGWSLYGTVIVAPSCGTNDKIWHVGDTVRDVSTVDGQVLRQCLRPGKVAQRWQPSTAIGTGEVCQPSSLNDCGFLYQNDGDPFTSGAVEPVWDGALTVADNGGTWTRGAAAAFFQGAAGVGGFVKVDASGGGSVTLYADDLAFLTESISFTGTRTAAGDLFLPQGTYRRWLWNRTAFALTARCATGNTVAIAPGMAAWVVCDGIELWRQTQDVAP